MWHTSRIVLFLLSVVGLFAIVAASTPNDEQQVDYEYDYKSRHGRVTGPGYESGYGYHVMWKVKSNPDELLHIVLFPFGTSVSTASTIGLNRPLGTGSDITSHPDGLYLKNKPVCLGKGRRVFVYTKDQKLRPIPLKENELKALLPESIDKLSETEVWKEKINPVLDEEAWRERPGE